MLQFIVSGDGAVAGVDWQFNAWGGHEGGTYADWDRDQRVAGAILRLEGLPRFPCPIVLEGGSIHTDGEGTLLTTGLIPVLPPPVWVGWVRRGVAALLPATAAGTEL